jgi:hypothetical protein
MKKLLWLVPLLILAAGGYAASLSLAGPGFPADARGAQGFGPQTVGADLDMDYCYDYLAPYGNWVNLEPWGSVWCPRNMGYRWRPYSDGHWVWTDYGWTWISDLDWGWMAFHYGRWGWDDEIGWFWVPGPVWGPAWVSWRMSDMYLGWAPIPPGMEFRAGMDFASLGIGIPGRFWIFIGGSHFMDDDIYPCVLPYERNGSILGLTTLRNNFIFQGRGFINVGMGVDAIRGITRRDVPRYKLQDGRQPGLPVATGNVLQMFRPSFKANAGVKPKTILDKKIASPALSSAKVFEPREQPPKVTTEADVLQRQALERKLLEESQAQEVKTLDQLKLGAQKKIGTATDNAKILQDHQAKVSLVTKQHQVEKQQLTDRHTSDAVQVKRIVTARQAAPPDKKKK